MSQLHEECGIAAIYHFKGTSTAETSPLCPLGDPDQAARLLPRMLVDMQNRGQLAAGITTYAEDRDQLIDTHKNLGTVSEVFRMGRRAKFENLMSKYYGNAGIGHVRYSTCGKDDRSYAQPFERHHLLKNKWFSFAFNGQLANYSELRDQLLADGDHHLTRETDTEIMMHEISRVLSRGTEGESPSLLDVIVSVSQKFDGAYSLVMLDANGNMLVARDPLGIKPLCYAMDDSMFAAASESVALVNLGFPTDSIRSLKPGHAITIVEDTLKIENFVELAGHNLSGTEAQIANETREAAHCFFEWIYFANVASTLDDRSVYVSRTRLGEQLADLEVAAGDMPLDDGNTIVVPVPDTSKAAADAMAHRLGIPSREGLIRNRYSGRTFIEGSKTRKLAAERKYFPLREVLRGKRVLLVEDSIVRSTTMRVLLDRIRSEGEAAEVHVRVACPPIVAPCFYGIDMSTIGELFAPKFVQQGALLSDEMQAAMAEDLGADSLRYLPVESIARAIDKPATSLCQACITGEYPTACGQRLYQLALENENEGAASQVKEGARTYESSKA